MADREENFIRIVERGVFQYAQSPYRQLFKIAGCELADLRNLVTNEGLEAALKTIREAGVYISFEEFKGRAPIVRNGVELPASSRAFDNPYLSRYYTSSTSGSTGAGTRVETDLDHLAAQAPHMMITRHLHGVLDSPTAIWRGILPDGSGLNNMLRAARFGRVPTKWFSPFTKTAIKPALKYRLASYGSVIIARSVGVPMPWPEPLGVDDAILIARWAVENIKAHGSCLIGAPVSRALRVCVRAQEQGYDLSGAVFMIAGEPATPAKTRGITRTGARYFTTYGLAEAGRMGMGCGNPLDSNDVHLLTDAFALIQHPRRLEPWNLEVPAFNVTSLLPSTPRIMVNVEIDDYGVVEERSCGCELEGLGYSNHIREIHSFRKLTGEGVTLVGSEMVRILEEVLPERFGGSALDYQLVEEEDQLGFTRLTLVISPTLSIPSEDSVIEVVLESLRESSAGADAARAIWGPAKTLRIRRAVPSLTARGKLLPLHLARRSATLEKN